MPEERSSQSSWLSAWRGRLDALPLEPSQLAAAVAALLVLVAAAVGWAASSRRGADGPSVEATLPLAAPSSSTSAPEQVVVHVAGAVVAPGVYSLPATARVGDAVRAGGGLAAEADVDRLNLAAPVADGERVFVPRRGQPEPEPPPAGPAPGGPASAAPRLDLNAATAGQLDALPGVGPTTARAIVEHRSRHGRFRSVDQLLEVKGIGPSKLAALRSRVRV